MAFVDSKPEIEYLAGCAVPKVSPKRRHGIVQGRMWAILRTLSQGRGDVATEWRCHPQLGPPNERLRALASDDEREEPPFAPDVAIEIRSPSDAVHDIEWKMRTYLEFGATVALDVLPFERTIRAFVHDEVLTFTETQLFHVDVLPWFAFPVQALFEDLDPGT